MFSFYMGIFVPVTINTLPLIHLLATYAQLGYHYPWPWLCPVWTFI